MKEGMFIDPLVGEGGQYFLSGNEAVARAALVAGVQYYAGYPGAPITGIGETMIKAALKYSHLHAAYSINESVAVNSASGASWTGARTLLSLKHVGMHFASDPIAYLGYTGTQGGLVMVIGMDPGAYCSTGQFDIRHMNDAFHWIMLEPTNVEDAYQYTLDGFALSEVYHLPVMLIMSTELCNQYGCVRSGPITPVVSVNKFMKNDRYINNGITAVMHYERLLRSIGEVQQNISAGYLKCNKKSSKLAIVASGCYYSMVVEALRILRADDVTVISPGMISPLPAREICAALESVSDVYVVEELDDYMFQHMAELIMRADSKLRLHKVFDENSDVSRMTMERLLACLASRLRLPYEQYPVEISTLEVPDRVGTFCSGCPYRGVLYMLRRTMRNGDVYGGDIGCSSLPPYYSDWLTCMGSGLGIAQGVAKTVAQPSRVFASMGDSTFFHNGMQALLNASQINADVTVLLLMNGWTAMTGHQPVLSGGDSHICITDILTGMGIHQIWEVDAYHLREFTKVLSITNNLKGVRVIIVHGECRQKYFSRTHDIRIRCKIDENSCHRCGECYHTLGCPAIKAQNNMYYIDVAACQSCGICSQICPNHAISHMVYNEEKT